MIRFSAFNKLEGREEETEKVSLVTTIVYKTTGFQSQFIQMCTEENYSTSIRAGKINVVFPVDISSTMEQ